MPGHRAGWNGWCWRWNHARRLSSPPCLSSSVVVSPRIQARPHCPPRSRKKKTPNAQRVVGQQGPALQRAWSSCWPLHFQAHFFPGACRRTAPEPVHWAARSGHFHSMQWKWKWHFCNLHHVTSVNALPLDRLPPSSPPSRPRPMGISTAVDRETLHESRRAVTAASRRVPSPTLDASEQFTWTTTLDTRRRASLTRHKPADEPARTPTRAAGD